MGRIIIAAIAVLLFCLWFIMLGQLGMWNISDISFLADFPIIPKDYGRGR